MPEGPPLGVLDGFRSAQTMISAGDGDALTSMPRWTSAASCWSTGVGAGPARAVVGGRDGGQLVRAGTRGRCWPTARRGRYRTKAERADRQRRESHGRIAPTAGSRPGDSHPPVRGGAPRTTAPPGARRAPRAFKRRRDSYHQIGQHPLSTPCSRPFPLARRRIGQRCWPVGARQQMLSAPLDL